MFCEAGEIFHSMGCKRITGKKSMIENHVFCEASDSFSLERLASFLHSKRRMMSSK
jgi:hypothetical protein